MSAETEVNGFGVAFYALNKTQDERGYLGALLITDSAGVPTEFRCTRPVKPTAVQKPLYGAGLEAHIAVQLCGAQLLRSMKQRPALMIIQDNALIGMRHETDFPVVRVGRAGDSFEVRPADDDSADRNERIESPTGLFDPIVVNAHVDHGDDVNAALPILKQYAKQVDPLEPFDRIAVALEKLAEQDGTFK